MAITTNNNNEIGGKITQALNAGSGVDIHNLAKTLAEAETMPRINTVTEKKAESTPMPLSVELTRRDGLTASQESRVLLVGEYLL